MSAGTVSYTYRGEIHHGDYVCTGEGAGAIIEVRYAAERISASTGRLPPETVARVLLGELVRDTLAKASVGQPRTAA